MQQKVNKVKQYNVEGCKRQYTDCFSKGIMHYTRQKLDPVMKYTVPNKTRKQPQIRRKTLISTIKILIREKYTKKHHARCKNLDNIAYGKVQ